MANSRLQSVCTAIAILGLISGTVVYSQETEADIPVVDSGLEIGRWKMFSPAGDGIMSGLPFLYDTATGRVWRFFTECGDDPEDANGCLVRLPAYPETDDFASVVEAMTHAIEEAMQDMDDESE